MVTLSGRVPGWASAGGGAGYGDGGGGGGGDGYGYGYGYGAGDGGGGGDGYGYGAGDGAGGGDVERYRLTTPLVITSEHLDGAGACADQAVTFARLFPTGARWPDDVGKAVAAGLDVEWARSALGLFWPTGDID